METNKKGACTIHLKTSFFLGDTQCIICLKGLGFVLRTIGDTVQKENPV